MAACVLVHVLLVAMLQRVMQACLGAISMREAGLFAHMAEYATALCSTESGGVCIGGLGQLM